MSAVTVRPPSAMAFGHTFTRMRAVLIVVPSPWKLTARACAPVECACALTLRLSAARFGSLPANHPSVEVDSKSQLPQKGSPLLVAEHATGRSWTQVFEQMLATQATVLVLGCVQSKHVPPHFVASESAAQIDVPGHMWKFVLQLKPHLPEVQVAVLPVGAGQTVQEVPHWVASLSEAQALLHG